MPYYNYICLDCEAEWEAFRKISERLDPTNEPCPTCQCRGRIETRVYGAPSVGDAFKLGISKPDGAFKERLQRIHERAPGSQLDKTSTITKI